MNSSSSSRRGFTLVEMLVSVAILTFMMIMMVKIIGMAGQTWQVAQNHIDNFTKARSMLDLITSDLERAVIRGDLPIFGTGPPVTPTVTGSAPTITGSGLYYFTGTSFTTAFYTRLPGTPLTGGTTAVRNVSLVSYVLNSGTQEGEDKIVLQRSDLYVPWTSGTNNLSFQGDMTPLLQTMQQSSNDQIEVAPGVVGFHLIFRRADGSLIDQSLYTGYNSANPVVAVNVGLAVIGTRTLMLLSAAQIAQIQAALAPPSPWNSPAPIKAFWDQQVLTTSFYSLYPNFLGSGLKTFERWVACPAF